MTSLTLNSTSIDESDCSFMSFWSFYKRKTQFFLKFGEIAKILKRPLIRNFNFLKEEFSQTHIFEKWKVRNSCHLKNV